MLDLKAKIDTLTIFQLIELQRHIVARMGSLGSPPVSSALGVKFKPGDRIEFYSSKRSRTVIAYVERVNGKSLSCHEEGTLKLKWRVSPTLARLSTAPAAPLSATPISSHALTSIPVADLGASMMAVNRSSSSPFAIVADIIRTPVGPPPPPAVSANVPTAANAGDW